MDVIDGGALFPVTDFFVGAGRSSHTAAQKGRPVSQRDLDATNALQETSWQIDTGVLDVAQKARDSGHPCLGVDVWGRPAMPAKVDRAEWDEMPEAARKILSQTRREARDDITSWDGEVMTVGSLLSVAEADRHHDRLWFAWSHDSRLRRYPRVSAGPSPQGSDLSRALIRFADGVELGNDGLYWLNVRLAGAAGHDKLDHDARATWTIEHTAELLACADAPLERDFWWKDPATGKRRDDPWAVLATTWEIRDALLSDNPRAYRSKLPVHVDGTCNGLQHLSAMGLDPIGARATNLTSDPERHDIYAEVAEHIRRSIEARLSDSGSVTVKGREGKPDREVAVAHLARTWLSKVDRTMAKRATMTTPYGVTARGIAQQLIEDDIATRADWGDDQGAAASWLRDHIAEAIGRVVVSARDIMGWLQETAGRLAKVHQPFGWTTPMGSRILQAYHPWSTVRPLTAWGRIHVSTTIDRSELKPRKQELASAPNFVHSFDAAHMAATILAGRNHGISHWAAIHDSYGTHAARMGTLNRLIREEFVSIYRDDWLTRTYFDAQRDAPEANINPPPARGTFDIEEVLGSRWFFA